MLCAAALHGVLPAVVKALNVVNDLEGTELDAGHNGEVQSAKGAIAAARTRQILQTGFELLLRHHGAKALAALHTAGIEAAILKGPVFARHLYANPAMRSFTDINILIPFSARATATAVLPGVGFELHTRDYRAGKDYCQDSWVLIDDPRVSIEIHSDLVHNPKLRRAASVTLADVTNAGNGNTADATAILFVAAAHGAISHQFDRLDTVELPIAQLEDLAFEKLFLPARPLTVVPMVARALVSLNRSIVERNQVAEEIRTQHPPGLGTLLHHYLGFQDEHGRTDNRYPSYIKAIDKQTDDLDAHGEVQRARFYKRFGKTAPKLHEPNFNTQQAEGLIPQPEQYADWMGMFVMRPNKHRLLWRTRLRRRLMGSSTHSAPSGGCAPVSSIGYSSRSPACCVKLPVSLFMRAGGSFASYDLVASGAASARHLNDRQNPPHGGST